MWLRSVRKLLSNAFGDVGHCSDPTLGCASSAPSGRSAAPRILHGVILTIPMPHKPDVFVPQGYKKGPQTGWRKTTEIYFLTVAKAGSSKSRCRQGRVPLRLWVEPFRASCGSGGDHRSLAFLGRQQRHTNLCLRCHVAFSLCVSVSRSPSSYKDPGPTGLRVHPTPV